MQLTAIIIGLSGQALRRPGRARLMARRIMATSSSVWSRRLAPFRF